MLISQYIIIERSQSTINPRKKMLNDYTFYDEKKLRNILCHNVMKKLNRMTIGTREVKYKEVYASVKRKCTNQFYVPNKVLGYYSNINECAFALSLKNMKSTDECFLIHKNDKNRRCRVPILKFWVVHYNSELTKIKSKQKIVLFHNLNEILIMIFNYNVPIGKYCILSFKIKTHIWDLGK